MNYIEHLAANWRVAAHALRDFWAHFIDGLIPCIKIRHHQPPYISEKHTCRSATCFILKAPGTAIPGRFFMP